MKDANSFRLWLRWLGDPAPRGAAPEIRPSPAVLERLLAEGEGHGVLPAIVRNLRRLVRQQGGADGLLEGAVERGNLLVAQMLGLSEMLRAIEAEVLEACRARGAEVMVVKGSSFADRLYPDAALRPFGDADLLAPDRSLAGVRAALAACGLTLARNTATKHAGGYAEEKWVHPLLGRSPVELHWDMVTSPKVRRTISLPFDLLAPLHSPAGLAPEGLLLVAAVHGAAGHGFERLQQVFDVVQAARGAAGAIDAPAVATLSSRVGHGLPLHSALQVAAKVTGDAPTARLAAAVGGGGRAAGLAALLGSAAILEEYGPRRWARSWRRQAFREALVRLA